jgi:hypothetical protein
LRSNNKTTSAILSVETGENRFGVPVLLGLVLFFRQLTPETHSLLLFLFFRVFLLILFHLELHHLDAPLSERNIFSKIGLMIIDILRVGSLVLEDAAVSTTNQDMRGV